MSEQVFTQCTVGGPVRVYVEDGVITRMRPIIFDETDAASWTIDARGKKYTPPRKTTLQSWEVPERQRVYNNRIHYPMRRKNFDPNGDRHPELRGKDEYVRISWDEALDLVSGEITRIRATYGPAAITAMTSSHHNWGFLHYKLGPLGRFFNILGYSQCNDNPDSWEGWHWGATHTWGYWWRLGHCEQSELLQDALKHTEQIIFWSVDPNSTSYMYSGQENLIWRHWMKEHGHPVRGHRPAQQLYGQHHGRQVDSSASGHRRGAGRGHRARVAHGGHLRSLLHREPHLRF